MSYKSHWEENKQKFVEESLANYKKSADASSGYDLLRYAEKGLLSCASGVDANLFLGWYSLNQAYVILRLAKEGKLVFSGG